MILDIDLISAHIQDINFDILIERAVALRASDLHLCVGLPPMCRVNNCFTALKYKEIEKDDVLSLVNSILHDEQKNILEVRGEIDLAYTCPCCRCRINIFRQKDCYSLSIRLLNFEIRNFNQLGLPSILTDLCNLNRGFILVTGPAGTGKTTTLAAIIDYINTHRQCHIVTLEDPIEYIHHHKKSIVNQREIGRDSLSYSNALRAVLRQDPDVILIGEMRDFESISIALTAAETGHLVLSTLHTIGASKTIDRIIDVFPPHQQNQVRTQLSMVLKAVISQQLIPTIDKKGRTLAAEIMLTTPAICNLIRENKIHQISNVIQTSSNCGMKPMDFSILELYHYKKISAADAVKHAVDPQYVKKRILT